MGSIPVAGAKIEAKFATTEYEVSLAFLGGRL